MNENDWKNAINHAAELAAEKAEAKGREEERMKNAKNLQNLLSLGVPAETIAKATGMSVDQVLELK